LPAILQLPSRRLVFSQEGVQLFYHVAYWVRGGHVEWRSVRRWTLQPSRRMESYAVASFYLSWGRRVKFRIHVSQQEQVENLLRRFGHQV
jgi:hypothetical protein